MRPINDIWIKVIPHDRQRYPTVGDWYEQDGTLFINVSAMSDWRYQVLVAVHELVETAICRQRGITQEAVDSFDLAFEKARAEGNLDEPGDDPQAPYRREHFFATNVERLLADQLGVDWDAYDREVATL